jgi:hypothetical protein
MHAKDKYTCFSPREGEENKIKNKKTGKARLDAPEA